MIFSNQVKDSPALRDSFFELAQRVHNIDIGAWHRDGWWDDSYIPYTCFDAGKAVSNVSVFDLSFLLHGEKKHYIQLSTVMTDPDYRKQGLAGDLLLRAVADWKNRCDGIFLFSSDMALKFYAQAGFTPKLESVWSYSSGGASALTRLNLKDAADMETFRRCFAKGNPFSAFQIVEDLSLAMFHLGSYLADCIYYHPKQDAVLILDPENTLLEVYGGTDFAEILASLPQGEIALGFTPKKSAGLNRKVVNQQLFWLGEDCPFDREAACLPFLSHA